MNANRELRIEELLGRKVIGADGRGVGRIEEFRARRQGTGCVATEMVIGVTGLLERLDVGAQMLLGKRSRGIIVRWDQIDVSDPVKPRLLVSVEKLQPADHDE